MENLKLCAECKGKCCKGMGCHFSPDDFKDLSYEGLKKEIEKGYISIDWWEGNPFDDESNYDNGLLLRMRNVGAPVVDPSWGGRCILLTEKGCPFTYEERPRGGRDLIPDEKGCYTTYDKQQCAQDWYKHKETLEKLKENFKGGKTNE